MNQEEFLRELVRLLDAAGIAYMIAGSHASSYHGQPRATNDIDVVIDPTPAQLEQLLTGLGPPYYVAAAAARDALGRRGMFNVIHTTAGWKADLIIRKERPFSRQEFARRRSATIGQQSLPIASAEDVLLAKLEWHSLTGSERQWLDACQVAIVQSDRLDRNYLRHWAAELGLGGPLANLLQQADASQQPPTS